MAQARSSAQKSWPRGRNDDELRSSIKKAYNMFGRLDGAANGAGVAGGTSDTVIKTIV